MNQRQRSRGSFFFSLAVLIFSLSLSQSLSLFILPPKKQKIFSSPSSFLLLFVHSSTPSGCPCSTKASSARRRACSVIISSSFIRA